MLDIQVVFGLPGGLFAGIRASFNALCAGASWGSLNR